MFAFNKCLVRACNNLAVSLIDDSGEIVELKTYCLDHIPNPAKIQADIYNYIKTHDVIVGLNTAGMTFSEIDFSGKTFYGCSFMHCTFTNIHSQECHCVMSMFDFAVFTDCTFLKSDMQFTSFAGCKFSHSLFTDGDMIQNNYNGIMSFQSAFDNSDLYNSRFINARLVNTSFRNCNLKKTNFTGITQENVSFKMSNTREAVFDRQESDLLLKSNESVPEKG